MQACIINIDMGGGGGIVPADPVTYCMVPTLTGFGEKGSGREESVQS